MNDVNTVKIGGNLSIHRSSYILNSFVINTSREKIYQKNRYSNEYLFVVQSAISRQVALELQEEVVYLEALRHHLEAVAYRLVGAAFHHREVGALNHQEVGV